LSLSSILSLVLLPPKFHEFFFLFVSPYGAIHKRFCCIIKDPLKICLILL
jgi:hypothetical protein